MGRVGKIQGRCTMYNYLPYLMYGDDIVIVVLNVSKYVKPLRKIVLNENTIATQRSSYT